MTAAQTGVRSVTVLPAHELRQARDYGRPSHLSEQELLEGHGVRIEMLKAVLDAPACPYKPKNGRCPCNDHP